MKLFQEERKLRKIAIQQISKKLRLEDSAQLDELRTAFNHLDVDGNGLISREELKQVLHLEDDNALFSSSDTFQDIDYDDFITAAMKQSLYLEDAHLMAAFASFDLDGNGVLDREEIASLLEGYDGERATQKMIDDILDEVDRDGNGTIEYDEFVLYMKGRVREIDTMK